MNLPNVKTTTETRVRCKSCAMADKKSKVYPKFESATTGDIYYDEEGKLHTHTQTSGSVSYKCSNGHEWTDSTNNSACWCGWKS